MIISHKYKFIFIKTSKTASTSLEVMLSSICSSKDIFTPIFPHVHKHKARNFKGLFNPFRELIICKIPFPFGGTITDFFNRNRYYNHITSCLVKSRTRSKIWNNYFKFTIERNPWDKTVSFYYMLIDNGYWEGSFNEYLKSYPLPINYPKYLSKNGDVMVDEFVYYENLNNDLKNVFEKLSIPFTGLNVKVKSNKRKEKKHYSEYYTQKWQHDVIKKTFEKEIDMHGYKYI